MKSLILSLVLIASFVFGFSFVNEKEKEDKLSGYYQVFVNSFQTIDSTNFANESSFKDRTKDSLVEGFQMYTFDFESNYVEHHFLLKDEEGVVDSYDAKSKITRIETDGNFAYLTVKDESSYYSNVKEKIFVVNLNENPNFPMLSVFWKNGNHLTGTYSVDNNDLYGLFGESDPKKVFNN
jgi:hypothetical protein